MYSYLSGETCKYQIILYPYIHSYLSGETSKVTNLTESGTQPYPVQTLETKTLFIVSLGK